MATNSTKNTKPVAPVAHVPKLKGPPKQFQQDGHWIVKPGKTLVLVCICTNRYIKTRAGQTMCLRCMFGHTN
jgi:hypothetical protein